MNCDVEKLTDALKSSVCNITKNKDVAIAFSGGLDCGIISAIAKEFADSITLYTIGTNDSYDIIEAREVSKILEMKLEEICIDENNIIECIKDMISITGTTDAVTLSFEVPLYFVSKNCKEELIISGQGADEIFAGYSKYVGITAKEFQQLRNEDIEKLINVTLKHENAVTRHFKKVIKYPYLDNEIRKFADDMKIDELMPSDERKTILRKVAENIGQPIISTKKKKAAQYGSGTMNLMKKIAKQNDKTLNEMIAKWKNE